MSTVSWCRPFKSIGASVDERKQEEKRSFNSAWQSTRLLHEDNELEGLFSRLRLFSPSLTMSGCWQKTSVCARQTLGIVVIIDLLHSAHTVMGKCRNWTDQRHPGSTVGTVEISAAAGKEGGWLGGWVGDDTATTLATCFLWHPLMGVPVYVGYHLASHFCLQL